MKQRIGFLIALFFGTALLMALLKPLFMALYATPADWTEWWAVVRHGWSLDMTVAGYITALPLLVLLLSLWIPLSERFWKGFLGLYLGGVALLTAAICSLDLGLYGYWGYRIDSSVLLYLQSPKEAMASLTVEDWLQGSVAFVGLLLLFGGAWWWLLRRLHLPAATGRMRGWGTPLLLLLAGLCFLAIRGGVSVAVANVSKVYFSANQFLNHAATNPLFSLLSSLGDEQDLGPQYTFFEEAERAARFEEIRGNRADTTAYPHLLRTTRPNVVLILLESFGRTFTDETSADVTPCLNRYKQEGIWFENYFANSFRTDRGEVAVLNGYPAQTRMSIMKYPAKSRTLPSLAHSLGRAGYTSWFTYGGDLNFTDQAAYMYATGWQRLTWQKDLDFQAPTSKWGYADDVMGEYFAREVLRLDEAYRSTGEPFLAGWLTLSSHEPFEVPYARLENKILNAVAFTDEEVGRVVEQLRQSPAWENLLICLVADHAYAWPEGIAYNASLRHRIPMLWLGGAVAEPCVVEAYGSQIDLAATLLAQLDLPHTEYLFSKNLLSPATPKFGYWCFNDGFGVADASGEVIYDCTSDRAYFSPEVDSVRLNRGKVLLQTTYKDIRER